MTSRSSSAMPSVIALLACLAAAARADDRRLDHTSNGANCCDSEALYCRDNCMGCGDGYCGSACHGLWAMLPHCIPCIGCLQCKFDCEPWLHCVWDGVTDDHCAER